MNQASCPPAPWHLQSDAVALLEARGVRLLVHYTHSPVGAYNECALAQIQSISARQVLAGRLFAPTIVEMQVDLPASMRCGRALWGFPKTLTALRWQRKNSHITFETSEKTWRFRISRWSVPIKLRASAVQVLAGQNMRVPMKIRARARLAWRGRQCGVLLENFDFEVAAPQLL